MKENTGRQSLVEEINKVRKAMKNLTNILNDPNCLKQMTDLPEFLPIQPPITESLNSKSATIHSDTKT